MANNKLYGFQPKYKDTVKSTALLDQLNPYEFRKGMDYELTELGCSRLQESTLEEREKATEKVLKNLEKHGSYYSALMQFEAGMNQGSQITETSFNKFLETFTGNEGRGDGMQEIDKDFKNDKMEELKETIKQTLKDIIKEQGGAKAAAIADMEDTGEVEKGKGKGKVKGKSKKDTPVRKDRFDKEEEAIKDILFRVNAKGKKPKEEGDYTKDNPAEGSMLFAKDEMLAKYKELKDKEDDPKKTLEEYNKLLTEKNEEFKDAIEKYVEEFEKNGITVSDIYGEKLSDTIKNLQERLKLGINKSRAGVEEEARGMRREVALTEMTRDQHLRLLEIIKEQGCVSLREGTDAVKPYYEIAKSAYLEGVANALKL